MLATRIIPTVLLRGAHMVKGEQFNAWRSVGHCAQGARIYAARGCDELVLLDIGTDGDGPDLRKIEAWTEGNFCPITVGGGVRSVEDVRNLLMAGADKVSINSAAIARPELINEAAERFGSQCIVVSVDARRVPGKKRWGVGYDLDIISWVKKMEAAGAGEILLTSVDREGTLSGYDLDLIKAVAAAVNIPVIAHGGCGEYHHMLAAIKAGADAVAAGAMFLFTETSPRGAAEYLAGHNVEVRL